MNIKIKKIYNQYRKFKYLFKIKIYKVLRLNDLDALYTRDYFRQNTIRYCETAKKVVNILIKYFKPKSVIDIGCGNGLYLKEFENNGIKDLVGIDGSSNAKKESIVNKKLIKIHDLRKPFYPEKKYDLCLCIEVAEHIEKKYSFTLVETLTRCSNLIIFTAAFPGQGGRGHVNEQKPEFWINLFDKLNFKYNKNLTKKIKIEMEKNNVLKHISNNLLIFVRD